MAKILVVDDSSTVRDEVANFLKGNGLDVATAIDGKDGLVKMKTDPGIKLIVSDVNMPNMGGIDFVRTIKNGEQFAQYRSTPIVMLTTESSEKKRSEGQLAGAKAWMVKPFLPERLLSVVEKIVGGP